MICHGMNKDFGWKKNRIIFTDFFILLWYKINWKVTLMDYNVLEFNQILTVDQFVLTSCLLDWKRDAALIIWKKKLFLSPQFLGCH